MSGSRSYKTRRFFRIEPVFAFSQLRRSYQVKKKDRPPLARPEEPPEEWEEPPEEWEEPSEEWEEPPEEREEPPEEREEPPEEHEDPPEMLGIRS